MRRAVIAALRSAGVPPSGNTIAGPTAALATNIGQSSSSAASALLRRGSVGGVGGWRQSPADDGRLIWTASGAAFAHGGGGGGGERGGGKGGGGAGRGGGGGAGRGGGGGAGRGGGGGGGGGKRGGGGGGGGKGDGGGGGGGGGGEGRENFGGLKTKNKKPFKKPASALALPGRFAKLAAMEADGDDDQESGESSEDAGGKKPKGVKGRGASVGAPRASSSSSSSSSSAPGRFTRTADGRLVLNRQRRGDGDGKGKGGGKKSKAPAPPKVIEIFVGVTITELARKLGVSPAKVEKLVTDMGEAPASLEEVVGPDLIELIAMDVGKEVEVKEPPKPAKIHGSAKKSVAEAAAGDGDDSSSASGAPGHEAGGPGKMPRRAVVAVMGHVDHGKTTLLDTLRSTSVAAGEAGGITQHIGAFVVQLSGGGELTFLDTPGHAAFSAMRQRGASITDVAVLVCAADDGVMPQTREAAAHILAANCRYVVALTKCDRDGADPARVRQELITMGLPLEEAGGHVQCVEVSAVSGLGMEDLELALFLEAEAMELTARVDCEGAGVILEARLDRGQGAVATGLLRRGTLAVGDHIVAGTQYGRVRRLMGAGGVTMDDVGPSEPFEISGLRGMPGAGDQLMAGLGAARGWCLRLPADDCNEG